VLACCGFGLVELGLVELCLNFELGVSRVEL